MSVSNPTLITFVIYIAAMVLIGLMAYRSTNNLSDYILGGRSLGSVVTAFGFVTVFTNHGHVARCRVVVVGIQPAAARDGEGVSPAVTGAVAELEDCFAGLLGGGAPGGAPA